MSLCYFCIEGNLSLDSDREMLHPLCLRVWAAIYMFYSKEKETEKRGKQVSQIRLFVWIVYTQVRGAGSQGNDGILGLKPRYFERKE